MTMFASAARLRKLHAVCFLVAGMARPRHACVRLLDHTNLDAVPKVSAEGNTDCAVDLLPDYNDQAGRRRTNSLAHIGAPAIA